MTAAVAIQRWLQAAVLGSAPTALFRELVGSELLSAERIAIYREHFVESLTVALREVYPVTRRLVGEGFFRQLATVHVDARPPRDPRLSRYGEGFAATIAGVKACDEVPYLVDVARLEWSLHEAAEANESRIAAAESLLPGHLEVATPDAALTLAPWVRLLESDWPVDQIWRAHQEAELPDVLHLDPGRAYIEVGCEGLGPYVRALSRGEYVRRATQLGGATLGAAVTAVQDANPGADAGRPCDDYCPSAKA